MVRRLIALNIFDFYSFRPFCPFQPFLPKSPIFDLLMSLRKFDIENYNKDMAILVKIRNISCSEYLWF